jgi:hypothetical protein
MFSGITRLCSCGFLFNIPVADYRKYRSCAGSKLAKIPVHTIQVGNMTHTVDTLLDMNDREATEKLVEYMKVKRQDEAIAAAMAGEHYGF